ncbi:hypothetical protein [Pseudoalteromonas sp. SR41-6]|uniref:hypothetical protein n=1 Tax=Pseudoalteromonas sp. SR41-6 TaxID=2760948 RepID=UPI0016020CF8|nr:hypothetical protein [Pseudoalteromonas sp. SR41-6]MBB1333937.1 hypothetical protein [Pseudoalteromonas sp. SR41-6]
MTDQLTPQQRAEKKRNAKRKGNTKYFSAVRFSDGEKASAADKKAAIEAVITRFGGTREAALIKAFKLLSDDLK